METDWLRIYLQVIPLTAGLIFMLIIGGIFALWLAIEFVKTVYRMLTRDTHPVAPQEEID